MEETMKVDVEIIQGVVEASERTLDAAIDACLTNKIGVYATFNVLVLSFIKFSVFLIEKVGEGRKKEVEYEIKNAVNTLIDSLKANGVDIPHKAMDVVEKEKFAIMGNKVAPVTVN